MWIMKKKTELKTNNNEVRENLKEIKSNPNRKLSKLGEWMRSGKSMGYYLPQDLKYILK